MIIKQEQLNEICRQIFSCWEFVLLDQWLLWKYLTAYKNIENIKSEQSEIPRELTEFERKVLDKIDKKIQDKKSMPKFLFDKIYNQPIPDELWITKD